MPGLSPAGRHSPRSAALGAALLGALALTLSFTSPVSAAASVDYASSRRVDDWLRHPVLGDPSFDAFEHSPGNPVHRGAPPLAWPVNGFLFLDPVSARRFLYVGEYAEGYLGAPSRCRLLRETRPGDGWTDLGVVLQGDPGLFDRGGHTPDVSVVHDQGRYHMVYDWGVADFNAEGGLAYAWADRPEGPWHRAPEPITRNSTLPKLLGRYQRTYAATLIRRPRDWLITGMMDAAPWSWVQFVMTAPRPEGPWSERRLVRHVERDDFHPPLLEFYPAFTHDGFLYAPATSVARNRDFNVLFRVPLERATDPDAWRIARHGSLWHSDDQPHEAFGIWGQTFSGQVVANGTLQALFPSRDSAGRGTINLARRPWSQPLRERGFVLSGHQGPAFTCLRRTYDAFRLQTRFDLRGTARLVWDHHGLLGPDQPQSDAVPHPDVRSHHLAVELRGPERHWTVLREEAPGAIALLAQGSLDEAGPWTLELERAPDGHTTLRHPGGVLWSGEIRTEPGPPGALGWWVEPHTHLEVSRFEIRGTSLPVRLAFRATEALLGAGENPGAWEPAHDDRFLHRAGFVSRQPGARVKWNVPGHRFTLWSPRGPGFGQIRIRLDGHQAGLVDLRAATDVPSAPVWISGRVDGSAPGHAIVVQALDGALPVDVLVAESR